MEEPPPSLGLPLVLLVSALVLVMLGIVFASHLLARIRSWRLSKAKAAPSVDQVVDRLEKNLAWYDIFASRNQVLFSGFKTLSLLTAAVIPVLSGFGASWLGSSAQTNAVVGILGAVIVIIEGLQRLYQWEQNWLRYRATWQALDREKALYAAEAAPYTDPTTRRTLLAQNVEEIIGRENQSWNALYRDSKGKERPA